MFGVILISFGLIMCHGNLIQIKTQRGWPLTRRKHVKHVGTTRSPGQCS